MWMRQSSLVRQLMKQNCWPWLVSGLVAMTILASGSPAALADSTTPVEPTTVTQPLTKSPRPKASIIPLAAHKATPSVAVTPERSNIPLVGLALPLLALFILDLLERDNQHKNFK
ncbi:hypothetical protein ACFQET_06320 [Levilactobacillus tangyuanensis]|uniref:LPXTG cell wall anchor domain-containing protein n=1 Tax=Levilactobacillus tangyuanensis TaxID=2486021 RepID=A0ABW1TPL1_9LACO|nr:hypothetical protein [Levilactobacillus tangyuanensis]